MKKANLLLPLIMGGAILLYSCGKDDDASVQPKPEFPTEFSEKTVAENKQSLEDNGIELMNNITELKNTKSIQTSISFAEFLGNGSFGESNERVIRTNKAVQFMQMLGSFGKGKTSATQILTNMRTTEDTTESIQKFFDENKGIYAYNHTSEEWDRTLSGDAIVFKFPSTSTGTSNNAIYTISEYKGVKSSNVLMDDYYGDYPTALKADLTVDGVKELTYNFSASYNSSGDPTAVSVILTIGSFKLSAEVSNTVSDAKADYSLMKGDKNLFSFGASGKGNFSSKANQDTEDVGSVVTNGNAYFQILNIKFSGETDAKALETALNSANTLDEEVAAINANYKLLVFYADSKKKIADSEFYGSTRNEEYETCNYDADWNYTCVTNTRSVEAVEVRLVFSDGSKADLETYTETGFEDIQKQFENFVSDVENDME